MADVDALHRALADAEATATYAFKQWRRSPAGAKGPYWHKVATEARQDIVRITRNIRMAGAPQKSFDEELTEVLDAAS